MEAGKIITTSVTKRMRLRESNNKNGYNTRVCYNNNKRDSRDNNDVHHFSRNLLLNSRKRKQQQRALKSITGRKTNANTNYDLGILFQDDRLKNFTFTREVHDAISGRLDYPPKEIPGASLQALFNDMELYVSPAEVDNMIQCARQGKHVSIKNGSQFNYLTLGEFSLFARVLREMQKCKHKNHYLANQSQHLQTNDNNSKSLDKFEVFLGGSCNPTTWRIDTAIPELQKLGITYYNPQVTSWAPELVALEHNAKQSASLLLYVVDSQTRSVVGMMEVAYLVASGRCVVLVANPYQEGQSIMNETITNSEYLDLVNGQTNLLALVRSQGIKVHSSLSTALQCTANILRNGGNNCMTADEQVAHKLRKLREVFDSFDTNHSGEINLRSVVDAYQRLTNKSIDLRSLCDYLRTNTNDANHMKISFDQFCVIIAEFSVDDVGCESFSTSDDWFKKQFPTNHITQNELNNLKSTNKSIESDFIYDISLSGSCSGKSWRENVEPRLKEKHITYNITEEPNENTLFQCKKMFDNSRVILFYITKDTRSLSTMILAAHYLGLERNMILCIEHLPTEDTQISNEKLSTQAIKDYNRGRIYLADMAKRKQVKVFDNIFEALDVAISKCQEIN